MHADTFYHIALTQIPLVGPINARTLVSHFGGAREIFEASKKELLAVAGVGPKLVENILSGVGQKIAEKEMPFLEKSDARPVFFTSNEFPERLLQLPDCPILLFFKGSDDQLMKHQKIVAIVGTRKPTFYGKDRCEQIVAQLKAHNCLIISGLAFGIDIIAHKACVEQNVPTIGVLGHGFGRIYPEQHKPTAEKMLENGGLLTEFLHEIPPNRENFPMRNRIIAGLCDALVVVETAAAGGSMISANLANDYNREVFALPGRLGDKYSEGCNALIKNNRAMLFESVDDIAKTMNWDEKSGQKAKQITMPFDLNPVEMSLLNALQKHPKSNIDFLIFELQSSQGEIAMNLMNLELRGLVKPIPGARYVAS
jgi:DNA processing protein